MGIFQKLFGGGNQGAAGKMGELLEMLTSDLHLDATQIAGVKNAVQAFREKRKAIKAAGGDRSQIQQAKQEMKDQFIGLLNDQQKQAFTANLAKYDGILFGEQ
ncbi:MAG TPA: hypothetical protein PKM63_14495 [Panacibacter sp.]|nr:hypothetical protein [Panacibacter sp.]HNP45497.1 hypothetical protein [Panacibacter sp.]